jgi:DNA-binding transcriptional ArsR family regulator
LATLALTGPLSISELSDQLGLNRTTLSRNLSLIEDKGWIVVLGGMMINGSGRWGHSQWDKKGIGCFGVLETSRCQR